MKKFLAIPPLFFFGFSQAWAYGHSGGSSFSHTLQNALIHGLVYGVVFKVMHQLGLVPSLLVAGVGLVLVWLWMNRNQSK